MLEFKILDPSIRFVSSREKHINGIKTKTYYFTRLTSSSIFPIEITAINTNNDIFFVSFQSNSCFLESKGDEVYYRNDIVFYKSNIEEILNNIPEEKVENDVSVYKELFGVDFSKVYNSKGLVFDRIIYCEGMKFSNLANNLVADGYIYVFTDIASNKLKFGFFAGNVRLMRFDEYVQSISEYGASNIRKNIVVEQNGNEVTITNNTPFFVEIVPYRSSYNVKTLPGGVKEYTRNKETMSTIMLSPNESFTLHHEIPQLPLTYNMLENPIKYYDSTINTQKDTELFVEQKPYIQRLPYEFEIKRVGLDVAEDAVSKYFVVTGFGPMNQLKKMKVAVLDKTFDSIGSIITNYGILEFDAKKLSYISTPKGLTELFIKGYSNNMILKIDKDQYALNYTFDGAETFITQIARKEVFNNTVSKYQQFITLKLATRVDYAQFEEENTKIKIEKHIREPNSEHKALPYLLKSDVFKSSLVLVDLNEIGDDVSRPAIQDYIFKSYIEELDSVISYYQNKIKQTFSNFKFMDFDLEVSSRDLAQYSPDSDIWNVLDTNETNDFTFRVKNHLDELGYEISLENALRRLKSTAYVYTPIKNVVALANIGISLDGEWYHFGDNFYRASEVENPKITTFIDGKIKEYIVDTKYRFLYVKKDFFGYSKSDASMLELAKAFVRTIATGEPIDENLLIQNPALKYVIDHTIDNERPFPTYEEVISYPTKFIRRYVADDIKNKYVFPNIFSKKLNKPYTYGIYSNARANEIYRVTMNNALDVLDDVKQINIITKAYASIDSDKFEALKGVVAKTKYRVLGVEFLDIEADEIVEFRLDYVRDKVVNGMNMTDGMEYVFNNQARFGIYYNYQTKKFAIKMDENTKIIDYMFVIALFDSIIHLNRDTLDGFVFSDLGVYDIQNQAYRDRIESKYLYLPNPLPVESENILVGISINYLNKTIFIDLINHTQATKTVDLGEMDNKKVSIDIGARIDEDKLILSKHGKEFSIPLLSLTNMPYEHINYNGFTIRPYKVEKFLPLEYREDHLLGLNLKFTKNNDYRYVSIDFGSVETFEMDGVVYYVTLGGQGVSLFERVNNHISAKNVIIPIKAILQSDTTTFNAEGFKIDILSKEQWCIQK